MKMCQQPDRDVPKLVCGYPIPCPHHTLVIERGGVLVPPRATAAQVAVVRHVAQALAPRDPVHLGVITIGELTPSLNVLKRKYKNPHAYKKLRDRLQQWLMVEMTNRKIPRVTPLAPSSVARRRLTICRFVRSERYVLDRDNLIGGCKPLLDAAIRQDLIKDDNAEWVEVIYLQAIDKNERVEISVEINVGAFRG